jgi:predicted amidohydrolase
MTDRYLKIRKEKKSKKLRMRILLVSLVAVALLVIVPTDALRVAAVQMQSESGATPAATMNLNVATIKGLVTEAMSQGASLVTVPEFALNGDFDFGTCTSPTSMAAWSEPITVGAVDCSGSLTTPLQQIGCANVGNDITVSYNTCEQDGSDYYNTQVIVYKGQVLAKYRKYNVFYTKCFTKPQLELVTFKVQNATFGLFTCYDILFEHPKQDLVSQGVKYFSYSSAIPIIGKDAVQLFSALNRVNVVSGDLDMGQSAILAKGMTLAQTKTSNGNSLAIANI